MNLNLISYTLELNKACNLNCGKALLFLDLDDVDDL